MSRKSRTTSDVRCILLGVSGGIAAYKAVYLASKLTGAGYTVHTIMTQNACELIGPKSFEAVTGNPVYTSLWSAAEAFKIGHIDLVTLADVVVVAPATANIIAKAACGLCDDLLSTTLCACWQKPVLFAPAMNTRMWANPVVQKNVAILKKELKVQMVGPAEGRLACGETGAGRMAEPAEIIKAIEKLFI
jgi:phosphopantothenoylcysteine synthetase/decarboxylase